MRIRTHISTAVAGALAAVLFLGACGESSSRSRNVAFADESPTIATIDLPNVIGTIDVAVDPHENVYAVNHDSKNISRIDEDGTVDENWFELSEKPYAITVDSMGSVYVGLADGVVVKILSSGTLAYTINTENPVRDIAVDNEGRAFFINNKSEVAAINVEGDSVANWTAMEKGTRRIAVDKRGNFYAVNPELNIVTRVTPNGSKTDIAVGEGPNDVKVSPSGDVYVANSGSQTVSKIKEDVVVATYSLPETSPGFLAIGDTGIVYVLDRVNEFIGRIGIDESVVVKWAHSGAKPADIAVGPDETVYTANYASDNLNKIIPAGRTTKSPVAEEALKPALNPIFTRPGRLADGFFVQILNYDEAFSYSATATGQGDASVNFNGQVTVSRIDPGTEAVVTVTTKRAGYADGNGTASASSLMAALFPVLSEPVRTADGFRVVITNFDQEFNYGVVASRGDASLVGEGSNYRVVVTGLDPNSEATVTVTASREGYVSGTAQVAGSALAIAVNTVSSVEEESTSMSTSTSTSTSTTTSTLETTSTVAIVAAKTDVPIAPEVIAEAVASPAAGSEGVVVSVKTTEVVCSSDCVVALLGAANIDKGEVSVTIGDAAPIALALDTSTTLTVGSKDAILKFSVKASDGKETTINVPVTHSASVPEPSDDSSGTPLLLIIAIVLAIALLAGAGLVIRKRNA